MSIDWNTTPAALWRGHRAALRAVRHLDPVQLDTLLGIERQKLALLRNTERFVAGLPANHALLWGARGTGKSSLIKALLNELQPRGLRLVEVDRDELTHLPEIVDEIRDTAWRFILFCDDLSFDNGERAYRALKSILEGSVELPPDNVRIYATSNRRHLVPETMQENRDSGIINGELHYADAVEEKISLADRFGLTLSFYSIDQQEYLKIVDSYFSDYRGDREQLHLAARQFAQAKGGRSGRTARQFYNAWAGEEPLPE
ncbi:MAG TPA: ATP-binding protein [Gammaproteobacteria bacterium]